MTVPFLSRLADALLKVQAAAATTLRTRSARGRAVLGDDCYVLPEGQVINIFGDPEHIRVGDHARIRGELVTYAHAGRIEIGNWFYLGPGSMIWSSDCNGIRIGSRVLISANVMIHDTNSHPMDPAKRFVQTQAIFASGHPRTIGTIRSAPVEIGDDVWVGMGAIILKGVKIGARAIIGAGSVVMADVAADTLVPAGSVLRKEGSR